MIKYLLLLLILLLPSELHAVIYSKSDFCIVDNGITELLIPENKVFLDRAAGDSDFLGKILKEYGGAIKDVDEYNDLFKHGWVITFDSFDSVIQVINKHANFQPILIRNGEMCCVGNNLIIIYVDNKVDNLEISEKLLGILKTKDFALSSRGQGSKWLFVKDMHSFRNSLFLTNYLNANGGVIFKFEPYFTSLEFSSVVGNLDFRGVGTIGERRCLRFTINIPANHNLNDVPRLTNKNIHTNNNPLSLPESPDVAIEEDLVYFHDPVVSVKSVGRQKMYDVAYYFDIYTTGNFVVTHPGFFANNNFIIPSTPFGNYESNFEVVPLLNSSIKDIQYLMYDKKIEPVLKFNNNMESLFSLCLFMFSVFAVITICYYFALSKPKIILTKEVSAYEQIIAAGFNNDNWRDQYHRLLSVIKDATDDFIAELEKTYSQNIEPDFNKLKECLQLLEGKL